MSSTGGNSAHRRLTLRPRPSHVTSRAGDHPDVGGASVNSDLIHAHTRASNPGEGPTGGGGGGGGGAVTRRSSNVPPSLRLPKPTRPPPNVASVVDPTGSPARNTRIADPSRSTRTG